MRTFLAWYNTSRLMHRLGLKPPAEHEADYYTAVTANRPLTHNQECIKPGTLQTTV